MNNLEVKEKFVEAVFANDKEAVASFIHPDFVLRQAKRLEYTGTYYGAKGFFEFMEKYEPAYSGGGRKIRWACLSFNSTRTRRLRWSLLRGMC